MTSASPGSARPAPRDALRDWPRVLAARERPMAERLQVAVSWNRTVAALRSGLAAEGGGRRAAGD